MSKLFARFFLVLLAAFSFGISSAHAMHKDDPLVYVICAAEGDARAFIDVHAASSTARETVPQFLARLGSLKERCDSVQEHISDLQPEMQALINVNKPAIWSGLPLVGMRGWPHLSLHLPTISLPQEGVSGSVTAYLVIIKKASPPPAAQ